MSYLRLAIVALVALLLPTNPAEAQPATPSAAPGWTLREHATDVSTVSGGEALAADLVTGDIFVRSLQDPGGLDVQLSQVAPTGMVTILETFSSVRNSNRSGIAIDPLTDGGMIVADEVGGSAGGRIALIDLSSSSLTVSTLFDLARVLNPNGNGTGQQQYAPDPNNPNILYFWDSTLATLFRLDRSVNDLKELLAIDQGSPVGEHLSTFTNDIVFDPDTETLLLTDGLSGNVLEIDPSTSPATMTPLFSDLNAPRTIALDFSAGEVFVVEGNSISVGPRAGGSLSLVASEFTALVDITVGNATNGSGLSLFAVDKTLNNVYEISRDSDRGAATPTPVPTPTTVAETPEAAVGAETDDDDSDFPWLLIALGITVPVGSFFIICWVRWYLARRED